MNWIQVWKLVSLLSSKPWFHLYRLQAVIMKLYIPLLCYVFSYNVPLYFLFFSCLFPLCMSGLYQCKCIDKKNVKYNMKPCSYDGHCGYCGVLQTHRSARVSSLTLTSAISSELKRFVPMFFFFFFSL